MDQPLANNLYSQNTGTTTSSPFIEIFQSRDPTPKDVNYPIQKRWFNYIDDIEWLLTSFTSVNGLLQAVWIPFPSGGTAVGETITGNTGGPLIPTLGNWNIVTANTTVKFAGSGSTLTQDFGLSNLLLGSNGSTIAGGVQNVGYGQNALESAITAGSNVAIGAQSLSENQGGGGNTAVGNRSLIIYNPAGTVPQALNVAVGNNSLAFLLTGLRNTCIGSYSGLNYTTNESNNIIISNPGVVAESNVIRIGTQGTGNGQQSTCYIAGIAGNTSVSTPQVVVVNTTAGTSIGNLGTINLSSNGQLLIGSATGPAAATLTAGSGIAIVNGANSITINAIAGETEPSFDNFGLVQTSTTLKLTSSTGTAFNSTTNKGFVTLPSFTTPGIYKIYTVTADITVTQANIGNNLFGLTTGISYQDWNSNPISLPMFIYAVANYGATGPSPAPETLVSFFLSRFPNTTISPVAGNIGKSGTTLCSTQGSFFAMDSSITVADYASSPCQCIGSVRMNYTGTAWTFTALASSDGIGLFQEGVYFTCPAGQFGASSGTFFAPNGGTAPVFSPSLGGTQMNVNRNNTYQYDLALGNPTTHGATGGDLQLAGPYVKGGGCQGYWFGLYQSGSTYVVGIAGGVPGGSASNLIEFFYTTTGPLQNLDWVASGNKLNLTVLVPIVFA